MPPSSDACWLALRRVRGVGPRKYRVLIDSFGSPEKIFQLGEEEITAAGIPAAVARNIADFRGFEELEKELCELPRLGARLLRITDPDYPPNLKQIPDPPPYLFVRGEAPLDDSRCVAIVGARAASDGGRRMAQRLALEMAARGVTVVSGLARGIDGEAHRGALEAEGRTIGVMGCGIDVIYPREHRQLADAIVEGGGALITELPVGTQPLAENFPARNRILSGLCLGVVIVEAAERSGSLITARMALNQNREVFAVPGSPTSKTRGSNRLIKDGAILVECVEDVLEDLAPQLSGFAPGHGPEGRGGEPQLRHPQPIGPNPAMQRGKDVLGLNRPEPSSSEARLVVTQFQADHKLHVDSIIESTGLDAQIVLRVLLELELQGLVVQHPGKLFSLA